MAAPASASDRPDHDADIEGRPSRRRRRTAIALLLAAFVTAGGVALLGSSGDDGGERLADSSSVEREASNSRPTDSAVGGSADSGDDPSTGSADAGDDAGTGAGAEQSAPPEASVVSDAPDTTQAAKAATPTTTPTAPAAVPSSTGSATATTQPGGVGGLSPDTGESVTLAAVTDGTFSPLRVLARHPSERAPGSGLIAVAGPGKLVLGGRYTVTNSGWSINVETVSGTLSGVSTRNSETAGTITFANGALVSTVSVDLQNHPQVVPAWNQTTTLTIAYSTDAQALTGALEIEAAGRADSLQMSGPVVGDGYVLAGSGSVTWGGQVIEFSGEYVGAVEPGGRAHTWSFDGAAAGPVTFDDGRLDDVVVAMTETRPGLTGTGRLTFEGATPLQTDVTFDVEDDRYWTLTPVASAVPDVSSPVIDGLTLEPSGIDGTVKRLGGRVFWALGMPMSLVQDKVTISGMAVVNGPTSFELRANSAAGSILNSDTPALFEMVRGIIRFDDGRVLGTLRLVAASGPRLIDLPDDWAGVSDLRINFAGTKGGPVARAFDLTYNIINGGTRIVLEGSFSTQSQFELSVRGNLAFGEGKVPFGGTYRTAGVLVDGNPLLAPEWDIAGDIADAPGGNVPIGGGAALVGGRLTLVGSTTAAPVQIAGAELFKVASVTPTTVAANSGSDVGAQATTTTVTGSMTIQLSSNDTFTLQGTTVYVDEDDWTTTVIISDGEPWTPPGMVGLTVPLQNFSGTIVSVAGAVAWNVAISEVSWVNMTTGVTLVTDLSLGTDCPLTENCPEIEGVYAGFTNGALTFPDPVPDMTLDGAFLSDGSWARMDAVAGELTYNGIGISESAFTMWKGTRTDEFDPDLEMPDLSAENNGFNLEFCGQFIVTVPDIKTFETGGCVTWTPDGVVMGQTKLGGSLSTSTSTEGVSIGSTGLTGWAWTDLPSLPKVGIGDIDLPLEEGLNQLAAGMTIPANIMKAAGQPDKDLVIPATGWFKSGDFWLEGEIPINLKGSGVTLDSILVQIGKEASTFTLGFGANGSIKMQGNEFPIEALVKLKVGGGNNEISISVSAKGTTTSDTRGTFDLPTLLAEGNFEPSNTSPLDGTFDGKKKEFLSNGGFENAKDAGNLLTNSDFETGALGELSVNGDFEDGASGNFLVNNDFEDDNIYINGDFEQNADYWFIDNSKFTVATVSDSAPEDSKGSVALQINNINGQLGAGNGLYQSLNIDARGDRAYVLSVWARSNDNTNGAMRLYLTQTGSSGCSSADQSDWTDFTVTPTWRLYQLRVIGNECRTGFIGYINPTAPGDSIVVDRAEFRATTNPVYNNDFEMGVSTGWNVEANYAAAAVANDGAPKETSGGYALRLTNNNPSGTGGQGMYQFVTSTLSGGQTYKMSVWARSNTSSNATMKLELLQRTTRSGCAASGDDVQNSTFTVTPEWKQYSFNVTGNACKGDLTVRVVPTVNTQSIVIDSMDIRGSSYNWIVINNQSLPIITNAFDFDPQVSRSGTSVYRDGSIGDPASSWRSDGNGEWWFLNSGTWPNLAGDQFDISYDLFFPNSGARDIFNFGFYLNAGSNTPNGYAFRVQSANGNNQDSGFYTVSNGNLGGRVAGDANWGPLARNTWYRIRLSGSGGNVNASVVRKSDSVEVWNKTVTLPGGNRSGVFGQIKDGAGAAEGVRIDNLTLYSTGNFDGYPRIADVPGSARTGDQYLAANPPDNTWEIMWPTGQAPEQGKSYAVSAWVKSPGGNFSGELFIDVDGGAYEISDTNFTANGTWQKVTATLRVQQANHTDLRVGFRNMVKPSNGAEIQVDDMTVQELAGGWYPVPVPSWSNAVSVGITSDPGTAFAGSKAIAVASGQNTACGAYAEQVVNVVPTVGSTYTLTAQVKSNAAVAGQLTIQTIGGTFEGLGTTFTTTAGAWKPITVTLPINQSGHTGFLLSLCASQENMANPIYYDNLSFTAVNEPVVRPADEGWQASATTPFDTLPGLSKNGTVDIDNTVGNPAPSLRKVGLGAWKAYNTNGPFYGNGDFTAQYDAYFPAGSGRDIADFGFWVTGTVGTNISGYTFRLQTQEVDAGLWQVTNNVFTRPAGVTTSFTPVATNTWYRVKLTAVGNNLTYEVRRISDNALYTQQTVTLSGGNRAGMFTEPYHGASSTTGHRYDNMQISVSGNSPAARIMSNPSTARSGNGALRITNNAGYSTTAMRRTPAITPASGYSYTFSAWVRAASGTVNGRISAGTASSNFTADTTWRQVTVTTTATSTAPITIGIENLQAGTTLYSDDWGFGQQGLTQPQPWASAPASGGLVPLTIWSGAANAKSGNNYLEAVARTAVPGSVYQVSTPTKAPTSGVYTGVAWVKGSATQAVSLKLTALDANGNPIEFRTRDFTIDTTWQRLWAELPLTTANTKSFKLEVVIKEKDKFVYIDDAEIHQIEYWGGKINTVDVVRTDAKGGETAAVGGGFLRMTTVGADGGIWGMTSGTFKSGGTYTLDAYVKVPSGANATGKLRLKGTPAAGGQNVILGTTAFTATTSWKYITLQVTTTQDFNALVVEVMRDGSGTIDVDQINLIPETVVQNDPWVAGNGATTVSVLNKPSRAYESSGVMVLQAGTSPAVATHLIAETSPTSGKTYDIGAWVRSSSGTSINGSLEIYTLNGGGTQVQSFPANFTATSTWTYVTQRVTLTQNATTMRARITANSTAALDVDNVTVSQPVWTSFGTVTQSQVGDEIKAQSGSGYLRITSTTGSNSGVQLDTAGGMNNGTNQAIEVWVRSSNGMPVNGRLVGTTSGGSGVDTATRSFVANSEWQKVTVVVPITNTGRNSLRTQVYVDTANRGLDIDSMVNGQYPFSEPDGVTTELSSPNNGKYVYLWDDAFGIPGAHLWAISAEISLINGAPGLGMAATMYLDPTKMPGVMTGTQWIKGDMLINISRAEPCLSFGFDATNKDSGVKIDGGVFTTKKFQVNFAPKGCEVGSYVVPPGSSIGIDTSLGNANFHLLLETTRDDDNLPQFHGEVSVSDLVLAGTTYNTVALTVDITATSQATSMVADLTLPMGEFDASYNLEASADGIVVAGSVAVSDWTMVGGTFDVETFNYNVSMTVPFGAGSCSNFQSGIGGKMSIGSRNYDFDGSIRMECGQLKILQFHYLYWKGGTSFDFYLNYDDAKRTLAGGLAFDVERKYSWKFLGKRYRRHPQFAIKMDFWMPIDKPSQGRLDFYGKVSVSGGGGEVNCSFGSGGADDGCSLYAYVNGFWGKREYRSSW